MARVATLWPAGIRSTVVTPSATTSPGGRLARAISTPSSGCRRMTGAGVMGVSFGSLHLSPSFTGRGRIQAQMGHGGGARHNIKTNAVLAGWKPLTPILSPQERGEGEDRV